MSITGDKYLDLLVPSAAKLVQAVRNDESMHIEAMLADAEQVYGDPLDAARALVILLAAMVPDDRAAEDLLRWHQNPHEYRRLRKAGVGAAEAGVLASQVRPIHAAHPARERVTA
ncbi:hypothetical protein DMH01_03445 [Amycolatopsis sp. WAC 04182]|uniref:hypothetical protein n=1 Tax=Amycolatopsis sp. WAC 04182 TaxID=2203198 RepID=UPI000F7A9337|nr:hypothetical protein [Amycolatopsis sp. WAC 04182]RSN65444.1 hypothetical protein DMH01_03445 [Amycolatopsis sp. WAC 04182]